MLKNEAREKLEKYILLEENKHFKNEAIKLLEENNEKEILNRFYKDLEFGTAGMRGIIGAGSCYINTYNIKKSTQGIANYILKIVKNPKVAISYDTRHFSKEFAYDAAEVFAANGFLVYIYLELRPTPELSYTIRKLNCDTGIMITASHNPKEYNGYKAYWNNGAQIIPPHDNLIIEEVKNVIKIKTESKENAIKKNLIKELKDEFDDPYISTINSVFTDFNEKSKSVKLRVAYTPLHGTGGAIINKLFLGSEIDLFLEPEQKDPNPDFPTVICPNPEEHDAMSKVIETAKKENCDIALASDPDADRMGAAFNNKGKWELLNGNQIAILLTAYMLQREENPKDAYVIKSFVTTPLIDKIVKKYGASLYRTYTGFKWIGTLIDELKVKEPNKKFIFGCEESYGYLIGTEVRDKDAFSAMKGICGLMLELKLTNKTLNEYLEDIYKEFGYYEEINISKTFKGADGENLREELMSKFRKERPESFAGLKIIKTFDYKTLKEIDANGKNEDIIEYKYRTDTISFILENDIIISVRPSGTEPKIKFYISIYSKFEEKHNIFDIINKISREIEKY